MNKRLYEVLLAPLVSEKTTKAGERENSVTFWVKPDARKPEIKQAVESLFEVKVEAVRTSNLRSRAIRVGGRNGRSKGRKKAYVTLMQGHEITFAED